MSWYAEIGVHYSYLPTAQTLVMFKDAPPYTMQPPYGTFKLPENSLGTVIWTQTISSLSGRILNFWQHGHTTAGMIDTWYINASAAHLGLPEYGQNVFSMEPGETMEDFMLNVLYRMQAQSIRFLCIVRPQDGESQPAQQCFQSFKSVTVNQTFTSIQFSDKILPNAPRMHGLIQQHFHFQWYVVSDKNEDFTTYMSAGRNYVYDYLNDGTLLDFGDQSDKSLANTFDACWHASDLYNQIRDFYNTEFTCADIEWYKSTLYDAEKVGPQIVAAGVARSAEQAEVRGRLMSVLGPGAVLLSAAVSLYARAVFGQQPAGALL